MMGMPRSPSCARTSPCTFPEVATLLKMAPISPIEVPPMTAASATSFRVRVRSSPGLMPAATADAATPAASPKPNAVPFTDASAESMMAVTPSAECPSPVSFASACSMDWRRPKPRVRAPNPPARPDTALVTMPAPPANFANFPTAPSMESPSLVNPVTVFPAAVPARSPRRAAVFFAAPSTLPRFRVSLPVLMPSNAAFTRRVVPSADLVTPSKFFATTLEAFLVALSRRAAKSRSTSAKSRTALTDASARGALNLPSGCRPARGQQQGF